MPPRRSARNYARRGRGAHTNRTTDTNNVENVVQNNAENITQNNIETVVQDNVHNGATEGNQGGSHSEVLQLVQALIGVAQQLAGGTQYRPHSELTKFKKHTQATYNGTGGVIVAEDWIQEMEKTFDGMKVSEENKVPCASFMLKEGAYDWWLLEKRTHDLDQTPYTWRMFKVSFYEKYFPRSEQIQRENEFLRLIQGSKTVAEYEAEFARLSKFAPTYVLSDEARARRFEEGLRPSIKKVVTPYELRSYKDVVNKALLVERTLNETQEYRENSQRKRLAQGNFHGQGNSHRENRGGEQGKRHQTSRPDSKAISTITPTINV